MSRGALRLAFATALACTSSSVSAAPEAAPSPGADDATAKADALFRSAGALRKAGKLAEACDAFAESQRLAPGVGVALYLGDCYEHLGKSARAWNAYRDAERLAADRHDDKRAAIAHERAAGLEARVSHLRVVVTQAPAPAEVLVDGGPAQPLATLDRTAFEPGDHAVTLRIAGRSDVSTQARVLAGQTATVAVDFDSPAPPPATAPASPAPKPTSPPPPPSAALATTSTIDGRAILGYSLLGVGAAGIATGVALLATKNASTSPGDSSSVGDGAAIGSDVAFGIGGAALVTAIVVYLTAPHARESAWLVTPVPVTSGAGAFLRASF